jgi:hypothetical protein
MAAALILAVSVRPKRSIQADAGFTKATGTGTGTEPVTLPVGIMMFAMLLLLGIAQHLDDALEGKPLGNVLPGPQPLAELCARQLVDLEAFCLGLVRGGVAILSADQVERRDNSHAELLGVLLGHVLQRQSCQWEWLMPSTLCPHHGLLA